MTTNSKKKSAKLYRCCVSLGVLSKRETGDKTELMRLAAGMAEDVGMSEIQRIWQTPVVFSNWLDAVRRSIGCHRRWGAIVARDEFDTLWSQLIRAVKSLIIQLLVRCVTVNTATFGTHEL